MLFSIATETNQMQEMFQSGGGSVMVNSSANNYLQQSSHIMTSCYAVC